MTPRRTLTIAGQKIAAGETRDIKLKFSESYLSDAITIPIRVIRSRRPGPVVYLTGAIHGDELAGIGIIRELLYNQLPELIHGSLVCVPVVSTYGLEYHSRYLPDRRDLNRCFPGIETGSLTSRLAYTIFNEVIVHCDLGLDFHNAAARRMNYPSIRADMQDPGVKRLARMFGCELIINSKGPSGSLRRTAVKQGIPTVILEAGEVWKVEPGVVEVGVRGIHNVLKGLGMVAGEPEPPSYQVTVNKTTWVRAERGGFLGFHAKPGDLVEEGQELATNYSIFGGERNLLVSPVNGIVLGMTTMPAVKPGEPVYHIAVLSQRALRRIRRTLPDIPEDDPFQRYQDDLSTNVNIEEPRSSG